MNKKLTHYPEYKLITSILICCLALWAGKYSRTLLNVELEMPTCYLCRVNLLSGDRQ